MKSLSLLTDHLDTELLVIAGLRENLKMKAVSFTLTPDGVSAYGADGNQIGFLAVTGTSKGSGWVQSREHGSESIRIDLAPAA